MGAHRSATVTSVDDGAVRLLTWNVQGSHGVDVAAISAVIRSVAPDVLALQEIQRRQASALATALSMTSRRWAFKHWPVVARAEGLAMLTPHQLTRASTFAVRRAPFWDWRRRIGLDATFTVDERVVRVVAVHLSPHSEVDRRGREAAFTLTRTAAREPLPIIVGDLNDLPGAGAHAAFVAAGWVDAWQAVHADGDAAAGSTNWTSGGRTGRPPTQRIDYVLAPPGSTVEQCTVVAEAARFDEFAGLSDHLPLVAVVRLPDEATR